MLDQAEFTIPACENRTKSEVEDIAIMVRLHLYNRNLPCGAKAVRLSMATEYAINPLPSERTIANILSRHGLTNRRTGLYEE